MVGWLDRAFYLIYLSAVGYFFVKICKIIHVPNRSTAAATLNTTAASLLTFPNMHLSAHPSVRVSCSVLASLHSFAIDCVDLLSLVPDEVDVRRWGHVYDTHLSSSHHSASFQLLLSSHFIKKKDAVGHQNSLCHHRNRSESTPLLKPLHKQLSSFGAPGRSTSQRVNESTSGQQPS